METILGIKEVRSLGVENFVYDKIKSQHDDVVNKNIIIQKTGGKSVFINMVVSGLGLILVIFLGSGEILGGTLSLGQFVAFYTYSSQFYHSMRNITELNSTIQTCIVSIKRIFEFMDNLSVPVVKTGGKLVDEFKGAIIFDQVSFSYDGKQNILNDLSLVFKPNQITALMGENGAGKSTIFNLLLRFYEPQAGAIEYNETDINEYDVVSWRKKMAVVLQEPFIFRGSIKENLQIVNPNLSNDEIILSCKMVGLHEYITTLPQKYDTILGDEFKFSVGQKQRLAIARCLLKKADIILFDEATSALDRDAEENILEVIKELRKTHMVIMISHHPSTIKIADKVVLIEKGKAVDESSVMDLKAL